MKLSRIFFSGVAAVFALATLGDSASADEVRFIARDGTEVYGEFHQAEGRSRGILLLFHMAGSNLGEYDPLVPVLNKAHFSTLAIDQRSGGNLWGRRNETAFKAKGRKDYSDALNDVEAAIEYAHIGNREPIVLWGSSYSSALVFVAAAHHPEVKAVLSFSPAEYIDGYSIATEAGRISVPVYISSAPSGEEVSSARALASAVPNHLAVQYVPKYGVHGSSTLREDQNPNGAFENWEHVMKFLNNALPIH